jgi:hypothetical protein
VNVADSAAYAECDILYKARMFGKGLGILVWHAMGEDECAIVTSCHYAERSLLSLRHGNDDFRVSGLDMRFSATMRLIAVDSKMLDLPILLR